MTLTADVKSISNEAALELLRSVDAKLDVLLSTAHRAEKSPSTLSRADRALLARLLPVLGGVYGPEEFSSRDLAETAEPAVCLVLCGLSVKGISKLFARAEGIAFDGLMVRRAGTEFRVALWQVVAVPGSFKLRETLHHSRASGSINTGEPDA